MKLQEDNGKIFSNAYKDNQYKSAYESNILDSKQNEEDALKYYEDMLSKYGANHSITLAAYRALQDAKKQTQNDIKALNDYEDSITDRELKGIEDSSSHREDVIDRWEAKYGDNASDYQRYLFYKNMYDSESVEAWKTYRVYLNEYEDYVKKLANEITIEEARQTEQAVNLYNNTVYPTLTKAIEADNKVTNHRKDYLEQKKEKLKDQYETASDIADIKYQIWELTIGRDATDAEKDNMKLAFLTQQLSAQAKLVEMAKQAWKSASADEKLEKEQEYWNSQLQLARLQSEVLDIQEANTKRQKSALDKQRLAQDEYEDYVKRYEKYYLDHGMTVEDLEKDAKLVSGYDPDKITTKAINKTNSAIENVKENIKNLTKAVGEGIQNGVSAVTDNTSSMLDSCSDMLSAEKDTWFKAGASMVDGLAEGITSKVQTVVDTVTDLVTRMLEAMQFTIENGMDFSSGITPVIDMSATTSKSRSIGLYSDSINSYKLAKSIAQYKADTTSVTPNTTQSSAPVYSFTQNNYSPKSLSAVEIYRQTNNMISKIGKRVTV